MTISKATFAGGRFEAMMEPFINRKGVVKVIPGYIGGNLENPLPDEVHYGDTGHYEAIEIHYNEDRLSYTALIDIFLRNIDPTDEGGQFGDRGQCFSSAIFFHNDEQVVLARIALDRLWANYKYNKPIVTKILPATQFYPLDPTNLDSDSRFYSAEQRAEQAKKASLQRQLYIKRTWPKRRLGRMHISLKIALVPMIAIIIFTVYFLGYNIWYASNGEWPLFMNHGASLSPLDEARFDEVMTATEVEADALKLAQLIEDTHPLFINGSTDIYLDAKATFLTECCEEMTREVFWQKCSVFMASLGDISSYVKRELALSIDSQLAVNWQNDELIVMQGALPLGTKILTIANIPVNDFLPIIDSIAAYENASGFKYNRNSLITKQYVHIAAGAEKTAVVMLTYETGSTLGEVELRYNTQYYFIEPPSSNYKNVGDGTIALLEVRDFGVAKSLNLMLESVKASNERGNSKVIIDLRGSYEGRVDSWADIFRTLGMEANRYGFTYRFTPTVVSEIWFYWGRSGISIREPDNTFRNEKHIELAIIVDEETAGTALLGTTMLHDAGVALVIGAEPRNTPTHYGYPLTFKLTHSEFAVCISHVLYTRPNPQLDAIGDQLVDIILQPEDDALQAAIDALMASSK